MSKFPLSAYEAAGEIELGRGEVISTIDLAATPGNYPVYSSSAVGEGVFGNYGRYMFDEELITWSIDGGGRPFYRSKHKYSVTNVCGFLRILRHDLWDYHFLHALLEKLQSGIQFDYQMKAHPSVIRELYKFERIPMDEQKSIAQIIIALNTSIHQTEAIIEKLKQVKQGLLHDLLTRGVDANGELRPSYEQAPELYQASPLGWIPKEWTLRTIVSLGQIRSGSTPFRGKADRYFHPEGTPWVKTLDLNENVICKTDECITLAALRESSCSVLPKDSVLIAMYGGWEQIGRTAILGVPAATNQAISAVTIIDNDVVPEYVLRALQHGRSRWTKVAASTRKDPNITKTDIETFQLPMPSSRDEQLAIVTRFQTLLNRLSSEQLELRKRQEEKSGLMDDLLTGRVRVTPLLAP